MGMLIALANPPGQCVLHGCTAQRSPKASWPSTSTVCSLKSCRVSDTAAAGATIWCKMRDFACRTPLQVARVQDTPARLGTLHNCALEAICAKDRRLRRPRGLLGPLPRGTMKSPVGKRDDADNEGIDIHGDTEDDTGDTPCHNHDGVNDMDDIHASTATVSTASACDAADPGPSWPPPPHRAHANAGSVLRGHEYVPAAGVSRDEARATQALPGWCPRIGGNRQGAAAALATRTERRGARELR